MILLTCAKFRSRKNFSREATGTLQCGRKHVPQAFSKHTNASQNLSDSPLHSLSGRRRCNFLSVKILFPIFSFQDLSTIFPTFPHRLTKFRIFSAYKRNRWTSANFVLSKYFHTEITKTLNENHPFLSLKDNSFFTEFQTRDFHPPFFFWKDLV